MVLGCFGWRKVDLCCLWSGKGDAVGVMVDEELCVVVEVKMVSY